MEGNSIIYEQYENVSKTSALLRQILKAAKKLGEKVSLSGVYTDMERQELQVDRKEAQRDVIHDPSGDDFLKQARMALRNRLAKFKEKKAISIDSAGELLQTVIEKGYLSNITVYGYPYTMSRVHGLDYLLTNRKDRGDSYVEYKTHWNNVYQASEDGKEIPESIYVTFKLEGSSIVPDAIKMNNEIRHW